MEGGQGSTRIVYAELDVKSWKLRLPSAEEVRPASCPCCGVVSRPAGGQVILHGHGLRTRDQWGPPDATAAPELGEVVCRRYHCLACGAVLMVMPRGILRRRLYSASAIALALTLWGVEGLAPGEVRARVSPLRIIGASAAIGWTSLRRWARAVREAKIFGGLGVSIAGARWREVAAWTATALAVFAPCAADALAISERAFLGATHVS